MNDASRKQVEEETSRCRRVVENYIKESAPLRAQGVPPKLFEAMEYSLRAGGKRLRPILCLAAAARCGVREEDALPMALAVEMLHTGTLIQDDLPCMDDDGLRRGKPSNHVVFGEAMALLAGGALITQSVEYPIDRLENIPLANKFNALRIFSRAIGPAGVFGGQALDMAQEEHENDKDYVGRVAKLKTGAVMEAAVLTGAALGTGDETTLSKYGEYARRLALAFQITDDVLDVTASAKELGKTPGKDERQHKPTHVSAYGLEQARRLAREETDAAKDALSSLLPEDDFLILLADYLATRAY